MYQGDTFSKQDLKLESRSTFFLSPWCTYHKKLNSSRKGAVCFAYQATGWSAEMAQSGWWRSWPPIHPLLSCLASLHTSNEQVTLLRSTHLHTSHGGPGAVWTGREVELGSHWVNCTLIAIPLVGRMKVLHTLIRGMSSAALVAAVALPR